jgi:hypothetical protein
MSRCSGCWQPGIIEGSRPAAFFLAAGGLPLLSTLLLQA